MFSLKDRTDVFSLISVCRAVFLVLQFVRELKPALGILNLEFDSRMRVFLFSSLLYSLSVYKYMCVCMYSASLLQSSVSHDLSEIIIIC